MGLTSWCFREFSYLPTCPLETHIQPKRCYLYLPFKSKIQHRRKKHRTRHSCFLSPCSTVIGWTSGREREFKSKAKSGKWVKYFKNNSTGRYLYLHSCDWHWRSPHMHIHRHQLQPLQRFLINANFAVASLEDSGEHDVNSVGNQTRLCFASSKMALLLTVQ